MKIKQKISISVIFTVICVLVFGMIAIQGIHFGKNEFKGNYAGEFKALAEENEPTNPIGVTKGMVSVDQSYFLMTTLLDIDTTQYKSIGYKVTEEGKEEASYSSDKFYSGITINSNTTPVTYKVENIYGQDAASKVMLVQEIEYNCQKDYTIKPFIVSNDDVSKDGASGVKEKEGLTIKASGLNKIEAENLSLKKLVPQAGFTNVNIESYTGGQGLGGIAGGYQTFIAKSKTDVNVALSIAFAKYEGGSILSYINGVTVNNQKLTLTDGTVANGTADNPYWNVTNVEVAVVALKANIEYEFKVKVNCGNLDGYVLEVVTDQGVAVPDTKETPFDIEIAKTGTTKLELETLDFDKCSINTRSDFVGAVGEGKCGVGSGRIYGFDNGSIFRFDIKVTQACTLKLSIAGFGGLKLNAFTYSLGEQAIVPAEDAALPSGSTVGEAVIGNVTVEEEGVYTFEFTFGNGADLDYVTFEVV